MFAILFKPKKPLFEMSVDELKAFVKKSQYNTELVDAFKKKINKNVYNENRVNNIGDHGVFSSECV